MNAPAGADIKISPSRGGALARAYHTCEACEALVPVHYAICLECGYDFEHAVREYDPVYRRLPAWFPAALGSIAAAALIHAWLVDARTKSAHAAALPEPPLVAPISDASADVPDLADPVYVAELVDAMMERTYPLLVPGEPVDIALPGRRVRGDVAERQPRHLLVETAEGARRIGYHELEPALRLRCDADYRKEFRRRSLKSELRRRRATP